MRAFEAVGQHLSFTAGAQSLSVAQSAVSRHVAALEDLVARPLFERGSAGLRLTPAGEALLPVVAKSLDRIEQTIRAIRDEDGARRPLRVHIPPTLLHQVALPILHGFRQVHPEIAIDISSTNVTGLPSAEIDMAIVFDRPRIDDQVTDLLWMVRVAPLCSPATAAAHAGKPLEAFLRDNELLHVKLEGEPRGLLWSGFAAQQGLALEAARGLQFETSYLAARYAIEAAGVLLGDITMYRAELAAGRLVMPFDRTAADGYGYYLKSHAEDLGDPAFYLLRGWMITHLAAEPADSSSDRTTR